MSSPPRIDEPLVSLAATAPSAPAAPSAGLDDDGPTLPAGHPVWQRDALSVSSRVRAVVAALLPLAVHVLTFWDHAVRAVRIGGRTLEIDPSGCYRLR